MRRILLVTLSTSVLSALVISNAYAQKQQFYSTVVYLLNSNRTLGVLYLQAAVLLWVTTSLVKNLFFGTLRAAEVEHLVEKSWYAVLETFILLAGFHQDMQLGFVATIALLFVVKAFHWLAEERIDYMERSPLITWIFHLRAVTFLFLLTAVDCLYMRHSWNSLKTKGASVQIVFGLEYAIMLLVAVNTLLRYVLHTIDLRSEDPWENKTIYMRYVDIGIGFLKLLLYVSYMAFMMWILFIPLHIARRIYVTAKNFQKSVHDVVSSHQAIRNLNTLYPDATTEELQTANTVCIICREDMVQRCKKLPCGHIFHTTCLRSWFQRQQVCPTCRMDVLSHSAAAQRARRLQPQPAPQGARGGPQPGILGQPGPGGLFNPMMPPHMWGAPGMVPPGMVPPQPAAPQNPVNAAEGRNLPHGPPPAENGEGRPEQDRPPPQAGHVAADSAQPSPQAHAHPHNAPPPFPSPFFPPPPPFMMPPMFGMQPPFGGMPSAEALRALSEEELRSLEGMERGNVEARIAVLRNIQRLLDSAVAQMVQYSAVMASMGSAAGPGFPGHPNPSSFPPGTTLHPTPSPDPTVTTAPPAPPPTIPSLAPDTLSTSTPPRPLVEGERQYSFSAADLNPDTQREGETGGEGRGGGGGGLFSIGETASESSSASLVASGTGTVSADGGSEVGGSEEKQSPTHVDELRQRRLQRFHSLPASLTAPLVEDRAETEDRTDLPQESNKEQ